MTTTMQESRAGSRNERDLADARHVALRVGVLSAWSTSSLTLVTFGLALMAAPDHVPYPFTSQRIVEQWPGDYRWMPVAMLLVLSFVCLVAAVHRSARPARQIFSLLGLCAAVVSAAVLLIDYFVQVTVMQPNLEKGQLDGWSMLTQYNPNGVFIAMEELGYLLMALALLCLAPVFDGRNRVELALRLVLSGCFATSVGALTAISVTRGADRGDVFEIAVICIVWLTLIAAGPLLATVLRRADRTMRASSLETP